MVVMTGGEIVEQGSAEQVMTAPAAQLPPLELDWPGLSDESDTDAGGSTPGVVDLFTPTTV